MRRRRINNRKRGGGNGWWLTLAVPAVVLVLAFLLSPGEQQAKVTKVGPEVEGAFVEGRHYDYLVKDSLLGLLREADPAGRFARIEESGGKLVILITEGPNNQRDRIVMLRNRSLRSLKEMVGEEGPFEVRDTGPKTGLYLPIREVEGVAMVPVPYDMVAGLMAERAR